MNNFFGDELSRFSNQLQSNTFSPTKKNSINQKNNKDFSNAFPNKTTNNFNQKDDFDGLLQQLLEKQQNKSKSKEKKQYSQIPSKQPISSFTPKINYDKSHPDPYTNDKNFSFNKKQGQLFKPMSYDDYSEDNKSIRSRGSISILQKASGKNINFNEHDSSILPTSSMRNMRPPLKKKQSRQPLAFNEQTASVRFPNDNLGSYMEVQSMNILPPMNSRKTNERNSQIKKPQQHVKQKIIQKIVHVKQDNKQIKQQHEKQLKFIKQTHDRQLKLMQEMLQKQIKQHKDSKINFLKENEHNLQKQRMNWKKIQHQNSERVKQMHRWELKKTKQTYEMEIQKLKNIIQTTTKYHNDNSFTKTSTKEYQLSNKQQQIDKQKKKLNELQILLRDKQRNLSLKQSDFQITQKRQQSRLQDEKKKLYQLQSEFNKQQIEHKKLINSQKHKISSQLAYSELQIAKIHQQMRNEREQLKLQKQMFERQKQEMQAFNKKILDVYKEKLKYAEVQKQKAHDLEVQLYKKIHIVQMIATQSGFKTMQNFETLKTQGKTKQNVNDNSILGQNIKKTKEKYQKMQQYAKNNVSNISNKRSMTDRQKSNLSSYLLKINKDKKMRPNEFH